MCDCAPRDTVLRDQLIEKLKVTVVGSKARLKAWSKLYELRVERSSLKHFCSAWWDYDSTILDALNDFPRS